MHETAPDAAMAGECLDEAAEAVPAAPDLPRLFRLWGVDEAALIHWRAARPIVVAALDGHEVEFYEAFVADPQVARLLSDEATLKREVETLAHFWHAVFGGEFDETAVAEATRLGLQHLELGFGGRYLLAASQRVLRRAVDAVLVSNLPERARAVQAVMQLVLLAVDIALGAYYDSVADLVSLIEIRRGSHELEAQMRALEEMVHVDSLTKLFNRRHFDLALEREIARAQRQQLPLSLVMVDVDRFKSVNDAYGHVSGDEVLCHVAEIMRASARKSDVLARYGGEEFVLILVGTPSDRARQVAERVRKAVEDQPVRLGAKGSIPVTISLGVADYDGAEAPLALIERADAALYRAKAGGRNQVAV